jgi:uncharacterized protein (TIGR00369 family)
VPRKSAVNDRPPPPLAASASAIPAEVRAIIAEITRYPLDILEPNADIEEELGIDSVKLGEILSVLRERYHLPPTSELRARFPATQLRTIGGISDAVVALAANGGGPAPAAAPPARVSVPRTAPPPVAAPTNLVDELRGIFAELTRYPLDILSEDADLEDDLGIDSVKLGEIFSVLRERYALPPRTELRDKISPAQLRSIGGITEIVAKFGNVVAEAPPTAAPPSGPSPAAAPVSPPPRRVSTPAMRRASGATQVRTRTVNWSDPMIGAAAAKGMAGLDYLRAVIRGEYPTPPIASVLDFRIAEVEKGRVIVEVYPAEYHYNPIGVVHGGLAATVLDSAMACAVHSTLDAGTGYATIEFKVNLVRPVTADVGRLRAIGEIVHAGTRVVTAQARLIDDAGSVFAHATETCLLVEHAERR